MGNSGTLLNLPARIAALRPRRLLQRFSRFSLPGNRSVQKRNRQIRLRLTRQLQHSAASETPAYDQNELMSKLGSIEQSADPPQHLRDFHEAHMLRIVDQYRTGRDTLATAEQLSELRTAVVRWAFRLTALEERADLGLVLGGSAVNGGHTFLTDVDFVVLPHREEDRESAGRVQGMMTNLMTSIGLDSDVFMPERFEQMTFDQLAEHYLPLTRPGEAENSPETFAFKSGAAFFRFLMDARLIDASAASQPTAEVGRQMSDSLAGLQDSLVYGLPDHVIRNCADNFREMGLLLQAAKKDYLYDIKNDPMRLFHFAIYANRADLGIREANFWVVIDQLREQGRLSNAESGRALSALRFFVNLRHLLSLAMSDTMDSTKISPEALTVLARNMGRTKDGLRAEIEEQRDNLLSVARSLLQRVER